MTLPVMNTHPSMPSDAEGRAIQALGADETTHVKITVTGTVATGEIAVGSKFVELNTDIPVHVIFGLVGHTGATTSARYLPAGSYVYKLLSGHDQLSIIRAGSTSGIASLTTLR